MSRLPDNFTTRCSLILRAFGSEADENACGHPFGRTEVALHLLGYLTVAYANLVSSPLNLRNYAHLVILSAAAAGAMGASLEESLDLGAFDRDRTFVGSHAFVALCIGKAYDSWYHGQESTDSVNWLAKLVLSCEILAGEGLWRAVADAVDILAGTVDYHRDDPGQRISTLRPLRKLERLREVLA